MDRRAAVEIVPMLFRAAQTVADTVAVNRQFASDEESNAYAAVIGEIVGGTLFDVLAHIIHEHPDLDPGGFTKKTK